MNVELISNSLQGYSTRNITLSVSGPSWSLVVLAPKPGIHGADTSLTPKKSKCYNKKNLKLASLAKFIFFTMYSWESVSTFFMKEYPWNHFHFIFFPGLKMTGWSISEKILPGAQWDNRDTFFLNFIQV